MKSDTFNLSDTPPAPRQAGRPVSILTGFLLLYAIPRLLPGYLEAPPWATLVYGVAVLLLFLVVSLRKGGTGFLVKVLLLFALCWATYRAILPEVARPYHRFVFEQVANHLYPFGRATEVLLVQSLYFFCGLFLFVALMFFRRFIKLAAGVLFIVAMLPQFVGYMEGSYKKMLHLEAAERAAAVSVDERLQAWRDSDSWSEHNAGYGVALKLPGEWRRSREFPDNAVDVAKADTWKTLAGLRERHGWGSPGADITLASFSPLVADGWSDQRFRAEIALEEAGEGTASVFRAEAEAYARQPAFGRGRVVSTGTLRGYPVISTHWYSETAGAIHHDRILMDGYLVRLTVILPPENSGKEGGKMAPGDSFPEASAARATQAPMPAGYQVFIDTLRDNLSLVQYHSPTSLRQQSEVEREKILRRELGFG